MIVQNSFLSIKRRAGIAPGSSFTIFAESCGCFFRTDGISGSKPQHLCLPHNLFWNRSLTHEILLLPAERSWVRRNSFSQHCVHSLDTALWEPSKASHESLRVILYHTVWNLFLRDTKTRRDDCFAFLIVLFLILRGFILIFCKILLKCLENIYFSGKLIYFSESRHDIFQGKNQPGTGPEHIFFRGFTVNYI